MTTVAAAGDLSAPNTKVVGRRVLATIVDGILLLIVSIIFSALFGTTSSSGGTVGFSLTGLPALLFFVVVLAYFIVLEGSLGQTVGKMIVGIKVVQQGSREAPGFGKATIRTLMRIIDGLFVYLVAFIAALASTNHRRLGDMVAGTLVVRK